MKIIKQDTLFQPVHDYLFILLIILLLEVKKKKKS